MNFTLECEREVDGRWLAEVCELPGALAYGNSADEAMVKAEVLALRVLPERLEHGEVAQSRLVFRCPRPHEPMTVIQSQTRFCCTSQTWLATQAPVGLSSDRVAVVCRR